MRICFIALGKFTHVDAYIDHFRDRGHEVHFVALAPGPPRNVPMHNVGFNEHFLGLKGKWNYLPAMLRARRVVRRLAPDIVHAHYATSAGLAAYICGVHPYIVTAHGTDVTQGVRSVVWRPILAKIFKNAHWVNPVSDELREMVLDLGTPPEKVETLTLGIDTMRFSFQPAKPRDPSTPLRFICTRQFEEVYDHRTIINGMAILAKQGIDFRLTLIGEGSLREQLRSRAINQGIGGRTTFVGAVPNSRLPEYLANQDIYLSASTSDGTSLSLLEAMASGVYPVVSEINANIAWIKHGYNGILHKVTNPQSLAEHLLKWIRTPETFNDALLYNRELVVKRGDRTKNMSRLEEIYRCQCRSSLQKNYGPSRPA
jgi:glycosyltransferase involved in cell wall biosynthesis